MPTPNIITGRRLAADKCDEESRDKCLLISPDTDAKVSHVFSVSEAKLIYLYGTVVGDKMWVEMVHGDNAGELYAPLTINGKVVGTEHPNTTIIVPLPGRYRLHFEGEPGEATAVCADITCCTADLANKWIGGLTP